MLRMADNGVESLSLDSLSPTVCLPTEPLPKLRRFRGMTKKKLLERIQLGHGLGDGSKYLPWLTLRKKNSSPNSNQVCSWMPPLRRSAHYFSRGEYHTALVLLWLGVQDLREQFPIWPIPHPHPLETSNSTHANRPWARGLLTISKEANIKHGSEFGTRLPYIASLDLLATVQLRTHRMLAVFSSKPISEPTMEVKWRTLERLELERRYTAEIDGRYFVSSSALVPQLTAGQLEWWLDASTLACAPELLAYAERFAIQLNDRLDLSIRENVARAAHTLSIPLESAWFLFRHCAWTQAIDIDPSIRVLTSYPVRAGGRAMRDALRRRLFGETW